MKQLINAINNMDLKKVIVDNYHQVVEIKGTDAQLYKLEDMCNAKDIACDLDSMYEEKVLVIMF